MTSRLPSLGLLLLGVWAVLGLASGWLAGWDARLTDNWFRDPSRQLKLDDRVRLILIDDRSLEALKAPLTFWAPHFSRLTASLINAQVAAVGLDWLPYDLDPSLFSALKSDYPELQTTPGNPWLPLFEALQKHPDHPMVQGIYPPNMQSDAPAGMLDQYRPAAELMAMLEPAQMGFLNLSRDRDGVLRRQTVLPVQLQQPLWGASAYPPFAARLAEVALHQEMDLPNPRWLGQPLPLAGDGTVRIPFHPDLQKAPRYSFSDVLEWPENRVRQEFAGKVVLIGAGTKITQDLVQTPLGEVYGVQAHAHVVNALLTGQFIRDFTPAQAALCCLLLTLLGLYLGVVLSPWISLLLAVLSELLYYAALHTLFVQKCWLGPVLVPMLGLGLSWALGAALRARWKTQEERYVRQLFGRYVSPAVMEVLLKDPAQSALGAVGKRKITVLFSDINGFSGHCEKKTPEAIMTMLNAYFEHMNRIIFRHGGTIKQFVGDEIMAMYGAPLDHPKSEEAAVLSAVEMMRHLESLRAADPEENHGFYYIKVGIHCGDVILGNVGSHERTEYAAVGDDVNLGSRIMGLTKAFKADILISKEVYLKVSHLPGMSFVPKGAHPVKGRVEPIEIYQVVAEPATGEGTSS